MKSVNSLFDQLYRKTMLIVFGISLLFTAIGFSIHMENEVSHDCLDIKKQIESLGGPISREMYLEHENIANELLLSVESSRKEFRISGRGIYKMANSSNAEEECLLKISSIKVSKILAMPGLNEKWKVEVEVDIFDYTKKVILFFLGWIITFYLLLLLIKAISLEIIQKKIISPLLDLSNDTGFELKTELIELIRARDNFLQLKSQLISLTSALSQAELAKQVSHDIRSPLAALTMIVGSLKEIPEDKRIIIRNATNRINDIANDLLQKSGKNGGIQLQTSKERSEELQGEFSIEFIPSIVDMLVTEKRIQFRAFGDLEIDTDFKNSFGTFAKIESKELKRVLSNLINNSVEAFKDYQGKVTVGVKKVLKRDESEIEIFIKDNGKGIAPHILEKLGQAGVTHGKEGTQSGSGLGVYHAKKIIEAFGGDFRIESTEGVGTIITITLPEAEAPAWFVKEIDLTDKRYLVSLDDDLSIHQIWFERLTRHCFFDIEHIKFQSAEAFEQYVRANIDKLSEIQLLIDFEFLNQAKTGLDVIEGLGLQKDVVLVTSRYDEKHIQARVSCLNLKLLPKDLAGFVPFVRNSSESPRGWT